MTRDDAQFYGEAYFRGVRFDGVADFGHAHFNSEASFGGARFEKLADFSCAYFDSVVSFWSVHFNSDVDLTSARFDGLFLERARIAGEFRVGEFRFVPDNRQEFDFTRTIFLPSAKLVLHELVELNIQPEKLKYISNPDLTSAGEEKKEVYLSLWESLLNCAYFSVMLFFTFRLKRDILTFFDAKEKKLIVAEWVIGFLVYVAFLTLSKSGSILHNLKELFVG